MGDVQLQNVVPAMPMAASLLPTPVPLLDSKPPVPADSDILAMAGNIDANVGELSEEDEEADQDGEPAAKRHRAEVAT